MKTKKQTNTIQSTASTKRLGHTPGPWRVGDAGKTIFGAPNGNPSPRTIARLPVITPPCKIADIDENIANAHLIAAAPELLAALEELSKVAYLHLDQSATHDGLGNCETLNRARAAIAKAKGQ